MQTLQIQNSTLYIGESYQNLDKYLPKNQIIIVTDENLLKYYGAFISQYEYIVIPTGEEIKSWETVAFIVNALLEKGADRSTFLLGFGGGIVTDIIGFVASIFMRGIRFGFVATTLLSQVDASLGGKNGVNFQEYKNMLGVFNLPEFVICDAEMLHTLPQKEVRSGFGEIIKHALIKDADLFEFLEQNTSKLLDLDRGAIEEVIWKAVNIKSEVVEKDWKEKGERKILNFGHTLGHAIEKNSNFTHGESVAVGMYWAGQWSFRKGLLCCEDLLKIKQLLEAFHLPTNYNIPYEIIVKCIQKDKKKQGSFIDFVFLTAIGQAKVISLPMLELLAELKEEK